MKYEIKNIQIWSVIKIVFIVSLLIGFISSFICFGILIFLTALISSFGAQEYVSAIPVEGSLSFLLVLFGTIGFAFIHTFIAVFFVVLYNIFSKWLGGFVINLESTNPDKIVKSTSTFESNENKDIE